jgi:hypothetical protein
VKDGTLTRRGKVVYRSHRSKRDRVKRTFYLPDVYRIVLQVYPRIDSTYLLQRDPALGTYTDSRMRMRPTELELLFQIHEKTSDLLQMVYLSAPAGLKLEMMTRLLLNNIIRKLGAGFPEGVENAG